MAGRPTLYSEAYCNEVIQSMGGGLSLTAFAGVIGVSKDTVYEWIKVHPDFAQAVAVARPKRLLHLETRLLDGEGVPAYIIFALKNADHDEWRDKHEHEHTGKDGGAIILWGQPVQLQAPAT